MGPFQLAQHNRWCSDNSTHRPSQLLSSVCPQTKWQHLCGTLHGPNNQTVLESHYPPQSCTGGTTGGEIRETRRTDRRGRRWGGRSGWGWGGRLGGDGRASRAVPVWREKAPGCLSADGLARPRRAQGRRPEGFSGALLLPLCVNHQRLGALAPPPPPPHQSSHVMLHV